MKGTQQTNPSTASIRHKERQLALHRKRRDTYQTDEEFAATNSLLRDMRKNDDIQAAIRAAMPAGLASLEGLAGLAELDAKTLEALPRTVARVRIMIRWFERLAMDKHIGEILRTMPAEEKQENPKEEKQEPPKEVVRKRHKRNPALEKVMSWEDIKETFPTYYEDHFSNEGVKYGNKRSLAFEKAFCWEEIKERFPTYYDNYYDIAMREK